MQTTKLTTKMMMVNHVLPAGGAYCTDNNHFNAYVPKAVVSKHSLEKYDEINCIIVPNVPQMRRVCPNMVLEIVANNADVETNVIPLSKNPTDSEPKTLPNPILFGDEDDEDVIDDNEDDNKNDTQEEDEDEYEYEEVYEYVAVDEDGNEIEVVGVGGGVLTHTHTHTHTHIYALCCC